eukprot:8232727-Pyramimonas_sp.AAC.1
MYVFHIRYIKVRKEGNWVERGWRQEGEAIVGLVVLDAVAVIAASLSSPFSAELRSERPARPPSCG